MKKTFVERFRRRISLLAGVLFLLLITFTTTPHEATPLFEAFIIPGFLLVATGVIGRLWCTTYIGGLKNKELVTDGPYSLWRNPLYVFSFIGLIGVVLSTRILLLLVVAIPAFLLYYRFVIGSEEKRLKELFGATFVEYCERVKVVVPSLANYWSRPGFEMNPKFYQRAMADGAMFFLALALVETLHRLKVGGVIPTLTKLPF
ncbi:MAG: hypothetical protein A2091_08080 [Desulfuromonadales bacterium GWD2_61_12]|nr:MAG: hypothetical protein A2005_08850 [Desulfuromonadales bacterium GWC2_61_20]OGR32676.1 MAG: hypothetical protein A2091_08080 [Desulfuromonadales bacterium GWD2_61_12]